MDIQNQKKDPTVQFKEVIVNIRLSLKLNKNKCLPRKRKEKFEGRFFFCLLVLFFPLLLLNKPKAKISARGNGIGGR